MKKVKKGKNNLRKFLVILVLIILGICYYQFMPIRNIYIVGNNYLTDSEIIELAGISNYPRLFTSNIKSKIKLNPIIDTCKVIRYPFGKLKIVVKENNLLVKDEVKNVIYMSNLKTISNENNYHGIPFLTNVVDNKILNSFLKKLDKIDKNTLSKISEITYTPNEYDKDLFLFMMNDGNYVYITTSKLMNINKYDNIVKELDNKKGVLYLDSGNHFKILDN